MGVRRNIDRNVLWNVGSREGCFVGRCISRRGEMFLDAFELAWLNADFGSLEVRRWLVLT
jgi:hypothetical protein